LVLVLVLVLEPRYCRYCRWLALWSPRSPRFVDAAHETANGTAEDGD
ncbi:MAG: hypothetical protein GX174_14400, partial [Lentisphaerae bacterium]|nr:hypothetical protein [Lentisphaerota bacterium]